MRLFTEPQSGGNDVNDDEEYSESFESDVEEGRSEVAKTGTELLNTSGAGELAALQQALQAAHLENTGDSARPFGRFLDPVHILSMILLLHTDVIAHLVVSFRKYNDK